MLDLVYRFRRIENLFGEKFKELERRQIYMAPAYQQNDPMDGYKNVVFRGDAVLWENLLRHYVLALVWIMTGMLLEDDFVEPHIPASLTEDELPTDDFRALYREASDTFLKEAGPASFLAIVCRLRQPLRREGVRMVLSLLGMAAFATVAATFRKRGLLPELPTEIPQSASLETILGPFAEGALEEPEGPLEVIALAINQVSEGQSLRTLFQMDQKNIRGQSRKPHYLLTAYPRRYIDGLIDQLIHPEWGTACFSATCTNAATWATYGDGHCGVALVYRPVTEGERQFIPLVGVTGWSAVKGQPSTPTRGGINGELLPVTYSRDLPEIEFFQSLGALPRGKLERAWYTNRAGERSKIIEKMLSDKPAWREAYWKSFQRVVTTKLEDWKHEEEYRIVLPDTLGLRKDHPHVEYDFSSLVGVVFGMKTSERHKLDVMKEISRQCQMVGRKDFAFYQMVFRAETGQLVRL